MKITILPDNNILLDEVLEKYIIKKIDSLEKFLSEEEMACEFRVGKNAVVRKNNKVYYAEAKIITPNKLYGARSDDSTIFEAVDHLKDELSRKIRNYKDKRNGIVRRGGRKIKNLFKKILR